MPKRDDDLLLSDMVESCVRIFDYTRGFTYDDFVDDKKTIDAVIRNFEVLGEAAKRVSAPVKSSKNQIEWQKISDFRNILIHDYFGINYLLVWNIIQEDLPGQLQHLQQLSNELSDSAGVS